jgi:hypothetical protein
MLQSLNLNQVITLECSPGVCPDYEVVLNEDGTVTVVVNYPENTYGNQSL